MLPVLRLGSLTLPAGPFSTLAAFYLALEISERAARRSKLPKELISNAALLALMIGIVGARLAYVVRNLSAYQLDLAQIFALNLGSLDFNAGMLIGLGAGYVYLERRAVDWGIVLDALAPALPVGLSILSLGNLLTGDAYGAAARDLPWAIFLWGEPRHPVQVYEMLAYVAIFAWLWFRAPKLNLFAGAHFLIAVILLAGTRVLFEPFRGDSIAWVEGLRFAQVAALGVMTGAGLVFAHRSNAMRSHENSRMS